MRQLCGLLVPLHNRLGAEGFESLRDPASCPLESTGPTAKRPALRRSHLKVRGPGVRQIPAPLIDPGGALRSQRSPVRRPQ